METQQVTERRRRKEPKNNIAEQFKESANCSPAPRKIDELLIPTGSTLLNCCCSDNPFGGFQLGKIVTAPGPSQSGKSIVAMSMLAAVAHNPAFDEYDLIYDDSEEALEFDTRYLFGEKTYVRVTPPGYDKNSEPLYSNTIQDLESNILLRCNRGDCKPFIWIEDSLDALTSEEELEREYANAILRAKDGDHAKQIQQSYNTEKAKIIGRVLRMVKGYLKKTRSTLIIIQQERSALNAMPFAKQYITSGGKAPFYYSSHQVRLVNTGPIYGMDKIPIGNKLNAQVVKNKLNGKKRQCSFCVYEDMGVDDVSSCVDYLCKNYWKSVPNHPQTFRAEELNFEGTKIKIIEHIENDALEKTMQKAVGIAWNLNEEGLRLGRQRRF
jgi:RecA/RadA recombinase